MKKLGKKRDLLFMLLVLQMFILCSMFFLGSKEATVKTYSMFCISFLLIMLSFYVKPAIGLSVAFFADFLYLVFVLFYSKENFTLLENGIWITAFPIIAFTSGQLGQTTLELDLVNQNMIDSLTGFKNKQKFYEDLLEISTQSSKTAVVIISLVHYKEVLALLGRQKTDRAILVASNILNNLFPTTNKKYRLEEDTLAVILNISDKKEILITQAKINNSLNKVFPASFNNQIAIKFVVKIDVVEHDLEESNSSLSKPSARL
ncbi:MAG TPA: GGDEF domain-containing protein [Thermoanaerobacterales bacterium]|uniref:GGDEF domain-containing protein n=1 Tax=Tepidanaerobacter sp. GT38 TaxID=2722793 RepID=UPI0017A0B744|nr:GGDEF domain-containing protein [Tepidanaerobacter sp. GT38]MCG1011010.1 GGDEF domain-containing protein [Tepidanaerobacter sp. GT38]HHY42109.1 GGDEF domain-containing protein [Thermoanaerobacterales bacterium]